MGYRLAVSSNTSMAVRSRTRSPAGFASSYPELGSVPNSAGALSDDCDKLGLPPRLDVGADGTARLVHVTAVREAAMTCASRDFRKAQRPRIELLDRGREVADTGGIDEGAAGVEKIGARGSGGVAAFLFAHETA